MTDRAVEQVADVTIYGLTQVVQMLLKRFSDGDLSQPNDVERAMIIAAIECVDDWKAAYPESGFNKPNKH